MPLTLRSKVDLIWTRAIRPVTTSASEKRPGDEVGPVIAQSVQFSKTAQKTEHRFMPIFFFSIERRHCSY